MTHTVIKCLNGTGPESGDLEISKHLTLPVLSQLTLFAEATLAQSIQGREAMERRVIPTSPDTSLPWSEDFALGGWSARMFLHQLLTTSRLAWRPLDTERLLSESTPLRLRANPGKGISLSAVIRPPRQTSMEPSFRTAKMVQGLIRRALARGKSLRLLLAIGPDTIPVIVIFGPNPTDFASWRVRSESDLPDYLKTGLLDFLQRNAPSSAETP